MSLSICNPRTACALALAGMLCVVAAKAEVVIMKDGYTVHGLKIVKEKDLLIENQANGGGIPFIVDKPNGMTAIDDGPRWVVFPSSPKQVADVSDANRFKDFTAYTRDRNRGDEKLPSTAINPQLLKPWDLKEWTREIRFNDVDPRIFHTVKQHINFISPHYLRVGSSTHKLTQYFLLKEFKSDTIRKLLVNHPDLVEKDKPDPAKRERLIRFWIQADWLDEADTDLARLIKDLPAEKERYARLKSEVNGLRAEKAMVEIERARDSGRHQAAVEALKNFPKEDVPRTVAVKVTALRAEYEKKTTQLAAARSYLDSLAKKVNIETNRFLVDGAAAVRKEIHMDTLSRLDMFLTLSERAEKDAQSGRRPAQSPEELIASAVTGWHLGKVAAEAKVDTAYRCWMTRLMALAYLRESDVAKRQRLLKDYLASQHAMAYDELEKLVSLLPPPDAPETLPAGTVAMNLLPSTKFPTGAPFLVRVPDEYQPGRSYPLIIALPDPLTDKTPAAFLAEFDDIANRNGYIVAVPQWWEPKVFAYNYSAEEQAVVLQLLRMMRRTFQVDSDRIFVWGNGEGGSMALDLGGSHPDLFAGVLPVNPSVYQPLYIPAEYWVNFHQLPVYITMGDKFGKSVDAIRMLSERWMPRGFSTLIVSYKGRGAEWFPEELPFAFDWMGRKRRVDPGKMVGPPKFDGRTMAAGFSSVRFTDNRFHWLSTEQIRSDRSMSPIVQSKATAPAKFSATIVEGNAIEAKCFGMNNITVWFGKGMLDYTKPIKVRVNSGKQVIEKIAPKIEVLMEDLYNRGDRQRPYFEKVDLKVSS
jgi:predicted esterase